MCIRRYLYYICVCEFYIAYLCNIIYTENNRFILVNILKIQGQGSVWGLLEVLELVN